MKKIHPSKISYYARNKRLFLSNARYKSMYRILLSGVPLSH